jgi:tRNA(His) 5'-end guanylyltransferase
VSGPERGDSLGDRMKKNYESVFRQQLPARMPVIIRVDGRAFHTLTRGCERPFDTRLMAAMDAVATALCEEVQGAQLAYVQSDEVSVLVHPYKRLQSQCWFDGDVQKMVSISASVATVAFNERSRDTEWTATMRLVPAHFDSRVFVLPEAEVVNYFIWRQQDATRNSLQMLARSIFSHRECENKNGSDLQEMCFQRGFNWNDLSTASRRGRCVIQPEVSGGQSGWGTDEEIPIFTKDRMYIERYLAVEPEE